MTFLRARSILVNFSLKKNLTSNGSKPIGILTHISLSYSDYRLPTGYSLQDFQPHQSNFLNPPPPWQVEYKLNFQSKSYVHYTSAPQTSWSQAVFTVKNTTYTTLLRRMQLAHKLNFRLKSYVHYPSTPQPSWSQANFTIKNTKYTTLLHQKQVAHKQFFQSKIGRTLHFYAAAAAAIINLTGVDPLRGPLR